MEVSGLVFRPIQSFYGTVLDAHSSKISHTVLSNSGKRFSDELGRQSYGVPELSVRVRPRKCFGFSTSGFSDKGALKCYVPTRCGGKKKGKDSEKETMKKKLKLLKGLWRKLSMVSEMDSLDIGNDNGKMMISEAAKVLLTQLQQVTAQGKEMKRKRKEEKAKLNALSSSSESSDSDCEDSDCKDEVNRKLLRNFALSEPKVDESQEDSIQAETSLIIPSKSEEEDDMSNLGSAVLAEPEIAEQLQETLAETPSPTPSLSVREQNMLEGTQHHSSPGKECCSSSVAGGSNVAFAKRIDVCMGGKCKKMGAAALLEQLEKKIGIEGAVVGCKCMGKCKNGPNVRVFNGFKAKGADNSVRAPASPLYIGVGLEDVGAIATTFLGEEKKDSGLIAT